MPGRYRVNGDNIFNDNIELECPSCGRVMYQNLFLLRDPYVRREECVICTVEAEKQELHEQCLERRLERAEEKRRRDLRHRRIPKFRAYVDRKRKYAKAQARKQGLQRYMVPEDG